MGLKKPDSSFVPFGVTLKVGAVGFFKIRQYDWYKKYGLYTFIKFREKELALLFRKKKFVKIKEHKTCGNA